MKTKIVTALRFSTLILLLLSCFSKKEKEVPINIDDLPGIYVNSIQESDSIIIHSDSTYTHINFKRDGSRNSQKGTWKLKENDLFLMGFGRYDDNDANSSVHENGSWAPRVITDESGKLKLKYSNRVYYRKID